MPEGPEVKTISMNLNEALKGQTLEQLWHANVSLRKPFNPIELKKREHSFINQVSAYGKVLFIHSEEKPILLVQLGMTGQLKVENKDKEPLPHTHVRWGLKNSPLELRYTDPRRFGLFMECDENKKNDIINNLGPDPFNMSQKDINIAIKNMQKSSRSIKEVLLDQKVITGVGNIYAAESLFLAKINPETEACNIGEEKYLLLINAIIKVLQKAFQNGGTTFSDYVDGFGQKGQNQNFLLVFKREGEPCFSCQTRIIRIKQGGRSTFFCPTCQGASI